MGNEWDRLLGKRGKTTRPAGSPNSDDLNGEGTPDRFLHFRDGKLQRVEESTKHDGRINRWSVFENGKLARLKEDRNGDGKKDLWVTLQDGTVIYTFDKGKLVTKEILGDLPADIQRQEVIKK